MSANNQETTVYQNVIYTWTTLLMTCFVSRTCGRVAAQEACQAHDTERVL